MKRLSIFLFFLILLIAALPAAAGDKVEICHFSPGGTASKAITVSEESAVRHIQEHGDHVGACLVGATL